MNREEIETFEKIFTQLISFHQETAILVKKDPDGPMNKFKLQLINKVIAKANELVGDSKPFIFLIPCIVINPDISFISSYIAKVSPSKTKGIYILTPVFSQMDIFNQVILKGSQ